MINNKTTMKLYNESYTQQSNKFVPYIIWDNNTISKPNNQKQVYEPTPKKVEVPVWDNLPPLVSPITIPTQEKPKSNANANPWITNKNTSKKSFAEILKQKQVPAPKPSPNPKPNPTPKPPQKEEINPNPVPKPTPKPVPNPDPKPKQKSVPRPEPKIEPKPEPKPTQTPSQEPTKITSKIVVKKEPEIIIPKPVIPVPKNITNIRPKPKPTMSWADLEDSDYESDDE
jgi:hypothetical protein